MAIRLPDGTIYIGRDALRKQLYATAEYEGVTGQINCTELGDCSAVRLLILYYEDPSAGLEGLFSNVMFRYDTPKAHK